jgi:hypothetical protein
VLFDVVEDGLTDFVRFLLEAGADPNIPDGVIMDLSLSLSAVYLLCRFNMME